MKLLPIVVLFISLACLQVNAKVVTVDGGEYRKGAKVKDTDGGPVGTIKEKDENGN